MPQVPDRQKCFWLSKCFYHATLQKVFVLDPVGEAPEFKMYH